jgi:hypothetical protein
MYKLIGILLLFVLFYGCSGGNFDKKQKKLDQIYGECDNPNKNLTTRQYNLCKDKERGGGESFFDLGGKDLRDLVSGGSGGATVYQYSVNPYLWGASIEITNSYSLKIADNQGGLIQTDWIYDETDPSKRCLIKIQILSAELISTGVSTKLLCENQINGIWVSDKNDYSNDEKQFVLRILNLASEKNNNQL